MNLKIILWVGMFIIQASLAFAQTGLFSAQTAGQFAVTGIQFVVLIIVARIIIKDLIRRRKRQ